MAIRRALVLGGGGVTGIAWETGLVMGLAAQGLDLREADLILGTSAGAAVGAALRSGRSLEELYDAQLEGRSREIPVGIGPRTMAPILMTALAPMDNRRALTWLGQRARRATRTMTVDPAARRAVIERRVGRSTWPEWPERELRVTAVDVDLGELRVFGRDSGVDVVDAVAASCAVPGVWPVVEIAGRGYMDGGIRSGTNADLARGYPVVVAVSPQAAAFRPAAWVSRQLRGLGADVRSVLITPDAAAVKLLRGNVLDPSRAADAARAGYTQAAAVTERVREAWT